MSGAMNKVLNIAREEIGYLEKASNKNLDDKTGNVGKNNYTKYARDLYPSLQGQPWCDMFVDWCFVKAFGKVDTRRLLGGFSAYTPTSAQYYKDMGQWRTHPLVGDQIFFENSVRICHTGIVTHIVGNTVYTIEGNTSGASGVISNGGGVCAKYYNLDYAGIAGYGEPDWSLVEETRYVVGWHKDNNGWWYADTEKTYYKECWQVINGHKYYFNQDGYALTDWHEIDGKWYYFEPRTGHPLECALYVTDEHGAQAPGKFLQFAAN